MTGNTGVSAYNPILVLLDLDLNKNSCGFGSRPDHLFAWFILSNSMRPGTTLLGMSMLEVGHNPRFYISGLGQAQIMSGQVHVCKATCISSGTLRTVKLVKEY